MNTNLNIDLILIENKQLHDANTSLTRNLHLANKKYNALVTTLNSQYIFMRDLEERVTFLMGRDGKFKGDLERIRGQRNELKGTNKELSQEVSQLQENRQRLEQENVWLIEQLQLSRRVGVEMEELISSRLEVAKKNSEEGIGSVDMAEKVHVLHLEKTRLELENEELKGRLFLLEGEAKRVGASAGEMKKKFLLAQSKAVALAQENQDLKRQLHAIVDSKSSEIFKNEERLQRIQGEMERWEKAFSHTSTNFNGSGPINTEEVQTSHNKGERDLQESSFTESKPFISIPSLQYPFKSIQQPTSGIQTTNHPLQQQSPSKNAKLNPPSSPTRKVMPSMAGGLKESLSSLNLPGGSNSPSRRIIANPFFPSSPPKAKLALGAPNHNQSDPLDKDTTIQSGIIGGEGETFIVQEQLHSQKVLNNLDSQIENLERMFV